jgi:hypothetical protein
MLPKITSTTRVGVSVAKVQHPWMVVVGPSMVTLFPNRVMLRLHQKIRILPSRVSITSVDTLQAFWFCYSVLKSAEEILKKQQKEKKKQKKRQKKQEAT